MPKEKKLHSTTYIRREAKAETNSVFSGISFDDFLTDEKMEVHESLNIFEHSSNNLDSFVNDENETVQFSNDGNVTSKPEEVIEPIDNKPSSVYVRKDLYAGNSDFESSDSCSELETEEKEETLLHTLRIWALKHDITQKAFRDLLILLKRHDPDLPLDPRPLNKPLWETPVEKLQNGSYEHIGSRKGLKRRILSVTKTYNDQSPALEVNNDSIKKVYIKDLNSMTPADIMRSMYEKVCRLEGELNLVKSSVVESHQLLLNRSEVPQHPDGLPTLPLKTFNHAEVAEDIVKNTPSAMEYTIKKLTFAGLGNSEKECAKKVMALLMSNHTGTFFNWQGQGEKRAFKDWALKDAVLQAVRNLRPSANTSEVETAIKDWLKGRKFVKTHP